MHTRSVTNMHITHGLASLVTVCCASQTKVCKCECVGHQYFTVKPPVSQPASSIACVNVCTAGFRERLLADPSFFVKVRWSPSAGNTTAPQHAACDVRPMGYGLRARGRPLCSSSALLALWDARCACS